MTKRFAVTFERWTEEAIERGATDDRGFVIQDVSLGDAIRLGLEYSRPEFAGFCEPSDSRLEHMRWLSFTEWNSGTRDQLHTGICEERALHIPDHVTAASRIRIAKLLGAYGTSRY